MRGNDDYAVDTPIRSGYDKVKEVRVGYDGISMTIVIPALDAGIYSNIATFSVDGVRQPGSCLLTSLLRLKGGNDRSGYNKKAPFANGAFLKTKIFD